MTSPLAHIEESFLLFCGKMGKLPCKPLHLELTNPNAKLYHGNPYQVPCLLLPLLKKEVKRLCEIGVPCKTNNFEWAAQGFAIPKKNEQHFHWQTLSCNVQQLAQTCQTC
jgi:hypothetical protein